MEISQIVISYAGTNPRDLKDIEIDLRTVGGFFDKIVSPGFSCSPIQQRLEGKLGSAK
ncbi:hypothetical protein [Enterococcus caccae]|uniref:Uncharacterized protein n=1 Tax=Enterococcus caccae ATCC BAA-1240 TaxID=1158612 RepID=R3TMY2_9ENTE|nr:hypothetical protein [Enterococcus caccae]EOL42869.1 hypothetical protein UC7_03277 [Enterococcus caccae ATCC BAA-1240]EOT67652.1 hypothetical protein I580_00034 [Enterococcus caccae ATCC BAA-1240]OJG24032.1 hypothetical protein RU98_GL001748 [Enterococcus caccae]